MKHIIVEILKAGRHIFPANKFLEKPLNSEDYHFLGCNAVWSDESLPVFLRNVLSG
jgi:hypothetical protein